MYNSDFKNYYDILGVPRNADQETIKARFHQLAKLHHPDGAGQRTHSSVERFKAISDAYQILKDPQQRQMLDDHLENRQMRRVPLGADESFIDRFAGIRSRPRGDRRKQPRFMRFLEVALSPRVLVATAGVGLMGYIAFGPRDGSGHEEVMVKAWYNPVTKRWESPAPWNEDFKKPDALHKRVHSFMVFPSAGPPDK